MLDEKVKAILIKKLMEWEGENLDAKKLAELRGFITKKTGKHKFLPYTNLKKWIREVKKEMKATNTVSEKGKDVEKEVQAPTVAPQKSVHAEEPSPRALISPFADRVYLQNLTYELSSMRRALERISKQLDNLENQLMEFKEGK